jgi:hypothetical protein
MKNHSFSILLIPVCLLLISCENQSSSNPAIPSDDPRSHITEELLIKLTPTWVVDIQNSLTPLPTPTRLSNSTATPCSLSDDHLSEDQFIGVVFPPFPCGVKDINSIGQIDDSDKFWLLQVIGVGNQRQLWLSEKKIENGFWSDKWSVVDAKQLPDFNKTKTYMYVPYLCAKNNIGNEEIFVYAEITDEVLISRLITNDLIKKAWILNFQKRRIEDFSTNGIMCEADYSLQEP